MLSFRARQCMPSPKSFSFSITAAQRQHSYIIGAEPPVLHLSPVMGHQRRLAVGASAGLAACIPQCIT